MLMEKSSAVKPLLNVPIGKAVLGGAGLAGLAGLSGLPGLAGAGVGGLASLAGDKADRKSSIVAGAASPYGGGLGGILGILLAHKLGRGKITGGLLGAGAGTAGTIAGIKSLMGKEAKLLKKASVAADGMHKEAFGLFKKKAPTLLQRLGLQNAEGPLGRMATSATDNAVFGPMAGLAGLSGGAIGAMNAPEGEGLSKGLSTGAGLLAAILGGRGGRKLLDRITKVNKIPMSSNVQRLLGYGGGGVASGLGAAKGVDMLTDQLDI
jgi:hypothetical protein